MATDRGALSLSDLPLRKAAMIAGLGYLVMTILAAFANFYALPSVVVSGNAATTTANIMASSELFRAAIACFLIVAVLDLVVAWALYYLFKPVNKSLSLLMAWFRIVYATIFVAALASLLNVLQLLNGATYLNAFETDQLQAQVFLSIHSFMNGWNMALAIFGLHLIVVGYLVYKSGYMTRALSIVLGVLLVIAGLGYLADGFGKFLFSSYTVTVSSFTFVGEVLLLIWLLWRGISRRPILRPKGTNTN